MEENANKNKHGANGIKSLKDMVDSLQKADYIIHSEANYRIADPKYGSKQFFFQYLIEFQDQEEWILHSTTSVRDRINAQQWHSENIKRLNECVKQAYIVVPDDLNEYEKNVAQKYNQNIIEEKIYSALDGVLPFESAYSLIEKKATNLLSSGEAHAKLGLHFEQKLVDALNNKQNFERWKNATETSVGYLYSLYIDVIQKLRLNQNEVVSFTATSNIPKLPSGGTPKTDVLLEVKTASGKSDYTFSCKRSGSEWVSVHEYAAEAFSNVLNPSDNKLKKLLFEFQSVGGIRAFGSEKEHELSECMKTYSERLAKWVIGGIYGEGYSKTQWAKYIITLNENTGKYSLHTIDEYINECMERGILGQFDTLFKWTYPSGGKGKRIQLKGKVL